MAWVAARSGRGPGMLLVVKSGVGPSDSWDASESERKERVPLNLLTVRVSPEDRC